MTSSHQCQKAGEKVSKENKIRADPLSIKVSLINCSNYAANEMSNTEILHLKHVIKVTIRSENKFDMPERRIETVLPN